MTEAMSRVYRAVMAKISGTVEGVFLDTPAGFQLNVDEISGRAVSYFRHHFGLSLRVASFKSARAAGSGKMEEVSRMLEEANFIFAGPGSPTYTVRNWRDTPILKALRKRLAEGAHLVFASAAAIAASRHTLPVYEIYKVGEDLHWSEGIDLLGPCALELVILPHWNNAEGGTHDTRFCFMGEPRFRILEEQLPASALILGIDEYTACVIDLAQEECRVMGAGGVTLRRRGRKESEQSYPAGATFPLSDLVAAPSRISVLQSLPSPLEAPLRDSSYWAHRLQEWIAKIEAILHLSQEKDWDAVAAMGYLLDLARAMEKAEETGVEATLIDEARAQLRRSLGVWGVRWDSLRGERSTEVGPMVDLLVQIRSRLRDAKQWALADEIRNGLSALGILLEDTPEGPRWRQNT
jgi:hypothetical protein